MKKGYPSKILQRRISSTKECSRRVRQMKEFNPNILPDQRMSVYLVEKLLSN
ncbi:unnamed protein product [marine sediment metagenome]|uniref:Uncharacterized protein n=1 Tax=marine sediment metagenome TaxID=412755 RepID=X0VJY7_9ZZZZ